MASQDPLLSAKVHVQYCEWLLTCRGSILPSNGDNLEHLCKALLSLSTYHPPVSPQVPTGTPQPSKHSSMSSRSTPKSVSTRRSTASRKVSAAVVLAHADSIVEGVQGARHLDEAVRVCVLWSFVAQDSSTRLQWLLHGANCASKMATAALDAILAENAQSATAQADSKSTVPGSAGDDPKQAKMDSSGGVADIAAQKSEKAPFKAPTSLQEWLLFCMSRGQLDKGLAEAAQSKNSREKNAASLSSSTSPHIRPSKRSLPSSVVTACERPTSRDSFTVEGLHCFDHTFAWLKRLRDELEQHACVAQCLPLMWLQVLLSARTSGRHGVCVMLAELANWQQRLGLSHQARSCRLLAGMSLTVTH
jgi:hypothetical protein